MEKEENLKINIDNKKETRTNPGDLKFVLKDFAQNQKHYLEIEKEEEEKQTLDNIFNYSARVIMKIKFLGTRKERCLHSQIRFN
jgi:hypothetical protein